MGYFTRIPESTFSDIQMDAGVLLSSFNPASPAITDSQIICATTGGINPQCIPTYSDMGEDVDNCPNNTKELKKLDGWDCKISTTAIGVDPDTIKLALGAADKFGGRVIARADVAQSDFHDLWWVGDRADGGFVALKLINALSTGGFTLQTTKNGKGQVTLELTGHVSINQQKRVPMEFYTADPETLSVTFQPGQGSGDTSTNSATSIVKGRAYYTELIPGNSTTGLGTVVVAYSITSGGSAVLTPITGAYDGAGHVYVDSVEHDLVIRTQVT